MIQHWIKWLNKLLIKQIENVKNSLNDTIFSSKLPMIFEQVWDSKYFLTWCILCLELMDEKKNFLLLKEQYDELFEEKDKLTTHIENQERDNETIGKHLIKI